MDPRDVCFDALMPVISKACCDRIRELLADDGDDRMLFHFSQCANLNDVERYKSVVNALIDARAARMRIRQTKLVASVFAQVDLNNAGLLSRCTTKKQRSVWASDQADSMRHLWSYFRGLAKRAKRSHNNTVNILKAKYRAVLKSERGLVASDKDDDDDDDDLLSSASESSEAETPTTMPAIADAPENSAATRTLPSLADACEESPELRVGGETFEERMTRLEVSPSSTARNILFEEFLIYGEDEPAEVGSKDESVVVVEASDNDESDVEILNATSGSESDASLDDPARHPPQRPDGCREIVDAAKTFALTHAADTRGHWKVKCDPPKTPRRRMKKKQADVNSGSKASSVKRKRSKASGVKPAVVTPERQPEAPEPEVPDTEAGHKMDATELTQKVMTLSPQFRGKPRRSSLAAMFLKMFPEEIVSQLDAEILGKITNDKDIFESHVVYIVHREERRKCGGTSPLWQIVDVKKKALGQVTVNAFGENAFMATTVLSVLATSGLGKDVLKVAKQYLG